MDLTGYVMICGLLIGVITGVAQMLKQALPIDNKYMPLVSCLVGVIIALLVKEFTVYNYKTMALIGFVAGMSASGFFDLTKVTKKKSK